ncbi:MAG: hypothetical protein ACTS27_04490 [Phycisphaerales bacterium]
MRTGIVLHAAIAALSSCVANAAAFAGGLTHTGDIILTVDSTDGAIVTNAFVSGAPQPQRVFDSEMGELVPGITDEPGFDCFPGTFSSGSTIGFRILDALRVWNGDDFSQIPSARLGVSFLSLGPVMTPTTPDTVVEGFTIPVQSGGVWHRHLTYAIDFDAPAGAYLLQLQLHNSNASVADSEPFWLVFDNDADPMEFADALAWAVQNLGVEPAECEGDSNGDNLVNFADLNAVLADFGATGPGVAGDVNDDGIVNFVDLNEVLANFGETCE